jgi:hypothetical protein
VPGIVIDSVSRPPCPTDGWPGNAGSAGSEVAGSGCWNEVGCTLKSRRVGSPVSADGRISIGGSVELVIRDSPAGVEGPGSRLREGWPITSAPLDDVKIGTRLISVCGWPAESHGIQMLYEAPSSVGV